MQEDYATCFLVWAPYTVLIGVLLRRQALRWPPTLQACAAHLAYAAAMIAGHVLLMAAFASVVPSGRPFLSFQQNLAAQFLELAPMDLVLYVPAWWLASPHGGC